MATSEPPSTAFTFPFKASAVLELSTGTNVDDFSQIVERYVADRQKRKGTTGSTKKNLTKKEQEEEEQNDWVNTNVHELLETIKSEMKKNEIEKQKIMSTVSHLNDVIGLYHSIDDRLLSTYTTAMSGHVKEIVEIVAVNMFKNGEKMAKVVNELIHYFVQRDIDFFPFPELHEVDFLNEIREWSTKNSETLQNYLGMPSDKKLTRSSLQFLVKMITSLLQCIETLITEK